MANEIIIAQRDMNSAVNSPETDCKDVMRIVSLLPSITEIVASLGVADQIVGITHECDYPPEAIEGAKVVTTSDISPYSMTQIEIHEAVCGSLINGQSLYGINREVICSVRPDIVFTQSLCDVCAVSYPVVLATCAKLVAGPPIVSNDDDDVCQPNNKELCPKVISMEPTNLEDVIKTFHVAARALGGLEIQSRADKVTTDIRKGIEIIRKVTGEKSKPSVAFLEWHEPLFTGGHWIPDMLEIAGAKYSMCESGERSAPIKDEDFILIDPDYILVGPCGFPLARALEDTLAMYNKKAWWKKLRAVKEGRVFALDGNSYYARPGPRLLQGTGIMAACIHGEEVGKELGEELAPSSGYQRVTFDMYSDTTSKNFLEETKNALNSTPRIRSTSLRPHRSSLFVAWNNVIVFVFNGFSPSLVLVKQQLDETLPNLKTEKFGSQWPKMTLAAEKDGLKPLAIDQLERLQQICQLHASAIFDESLTLDVKTISIVDYKHRSLENICQRLDFQLSDEYDPALPSDIELGKVDNVVAEWSDLETYLPKINASGSRISSYRGEPPSGYTCVTFLHPLPISLATKLANFQDAINAAFPDRYEWFDNESLHCTLRSLDT